jgi:dephospho-CoA kinase
MQIFLLTGGIATGKSLITEYLLTQNIGIIDSDIIAKQLTAKNGLAIPLLLKAFGDDILDAHGEFKRKEMRELVFKDADAKQKLEDILHPLIQVQTMQYAQYLQNIHIHLQCLFFIVPLFIGKNQAFWRSQVQKIVTLQADTHTRVERIMQRGLTSDMAYRIIENQPNNEAYANVSDYCINNNGNKEYAYAQINNILAHIL